MVPPPTRLLLHPRSASSNHTTSTSVNVTACLFPNCIFPPIDLPSPPPIPSFPVPDTFVIDVHRPNRLLPNFLIATAALIAVSLLFFCFLLRLRRRRLHGGGLHLNRQITHPHADDPHNLQNSDLTGNGSISLFPDSFDGTHHVWAIRTVGLDETLIKSIGSRVYKTGDLSENCSVCLGVFRDGEMVKILPKCKHAFHRECIDTWLKAHVNCPICRTTVLDEGVLKLDQLEIISLHQNPESNNDDSSSSLNSGMNGREDENEVQAVRRSVSMNEFGIGMLMISGGLEKRKKEIELGDDDNRNDGVETKMTMSSRSGRLFFPRYGRGRSASVLPF